MPTLNGRTPDIAEENISQLKQIFPDIDCDGKIDFDKLKQLLGEYVDDDKERYDFKWNGKGKALRFAQTPSAGTLRPCREESKKWDTTENLYIEGDNLEVLKLLQKSYHSKIKMIYIDPPYNTGKDFVYPDNFTDSIENYKRITGQTDEEGNKISTNTEASGRYHTDWLNMMYPRLRLARNLLTEDGVIFISIDDNEVDNLKKICNEVFGEENFVAQAIVQKSTNGMGDKKGFAKNHEFILCYQKSSNAEFYGLTPDEEYVSSFDMKDEHGKYKMDGILMKKGAGSRRQDSPTLYFPLYYSTETGRVYLTKEDRLVERYPIKSDGTDGRWTWGKEKIINENHRLYASPNGTIYIKDYLSSDRRMKIKTILTDKRYLTDRATNEIKDIFKGKPFDTPKPVKLIKHLADIACKDDDIVLDFFSGSATTAHAVMQLNAEDNGNRKFICVQLPEPTDENSEAFKAGYKNICEIGKERIRRAGEKIYKEWDEKRDKTPQLTLDGPEDYEDIMKSLYNLDIGFKTFKLDSSNLKKWNPDYDNLKDYFDEMANNYVDGRTEEDLVYEFMLKMGLDLTYPIDTTEIDGKKVYSIGFGALMMCLDDNITIAVADGMAKMYNELEPETWKVVFKDNGFESDSIKTNVKGNLVQAGLEEDGFVTV